MIKHILTFFDKLEDHVRGFLSRRPILYAIITSVGIILVWRGIWHTADLFPVLNGPLSFIIGIIILLATGVFVSSFIGNRTILSGIKGEKKLTEMTKHEVEEVIKKENQEMKKLSSQLAHIEEELSHIKKTN